MCEHTYTCSLVYALSQKCTVMDVYKEGMYNTHVCVHACIYELVAEAHVQACCWGTCMYNIGQTIHAYLHTCILPWLHKRILTTSIQYTVYAAESKWTFTWFSSETCLSSDNRLTSCSLSCRAHTVASITNSETPKDKATQHHTTLHQPKKGLPRSGKLNQWL